MRVVLSLLLVLSISLLVMFVFIAVHEAGHLFAGKLVGMGWASFKVGLLQVSRTEKGEWEFSLAEGWQDGYVQPMPYSKPPTRCQWVIILLGGSVANVTVGIAILLALLTETVTQQQQASTLGLIAEGSIGVGLLNLLPLRFRNLHSDGLQLWTICSSQKRFLKYQAQWYEYQDKSTRYKASQARYDAIKMFQIYLKEGRRPREWEIALIDQATAIQDGVRSEAVGAYYAYMQAVDTGDWEKAGTLLNRALPLAETDKELYCCLAIEKSFWLAQYHRDPEGAWHWLTQAEKDYQATSSYWRARAAIEFAKGNSIEAEASLCKSRAALSDTNKAELYLLESLK